MPDGQPFSVAGLGDKNSVGRKAKKSNFRQRMKQNATQ
jgi:hypothetical protein